MRKARVAMALLAALAMIVTSSPAAFAEWRVEHDGGFNGAIDLSAAPDGSRIYVVAETDGGDERDYLTFALDASTGAVIWEASYGQFGSYNEPAGVVVGPNGSRVFVSGTGLADGWSGMVTVAYDAATGTELWDAISGGGGNNGGTALAVSPNGGRVYVSGSTHDGRFTVKAYGASTGSQLWSRHLGHRSTAHRDAALAVTVSSDGGSLFVTGTVLDKKDQGGQNAITAAYRARDGHLLWARRYKGAVRRGEAERGIDIASAGSVALVLVDGDTTSAVLAYDAATGRSRWTRVWSDRSTSFIEPSAIEASGVRAFLTHRVPEPDGNYRTRTFALSPATGRLLWSANRAGGVPYDLVVDPSDHALYVLKTEATGGSVIAYDANDGTVIGVARESSLTMSDVLVPVSSSSDVFMAWTQTFDYVHNNVVITRTGL